MDYTSKQKKAINDAYAWLEETARNADMGSCASRLATALKHERSHRRNFTVAKALLAEGALAGIEGKFTVDSLYDVSSGIGVAVIIGAWLKRTGRIDAATIDKLSAARAAHDEHISERLSNA